MEHATIAALDILSEMHTGTNFTKEDHVFSLKRIVLSIHQDLNVVRNINVLGLRGFFQTRCILRHVDSSFPLKLIKMESSF